MKITFWNVDNEERSEWSRPSDRVNASLYETSEDADVDDSEAEDHQDHDVLGVLPEQLPLAEQVLMGETKQEESKTEDLNQELQQSRLDVLFYFLDFQSYQDPKFIDCKVLQNFYSWFFKDCQRKYNSQSCVEKPSEPPALVC